MKFFVAERKPTSKNMKNAANKARADVEATLENLGRDRIDIIIPFKGKQSLIKSLEENIKNYKIWKDNLAHLKKGDEVLIQFPILNKNIFLPLLLKKLKNKGVRTVILLHDLESLRYLNSDLSFRHKIRLGIEEKYTLSLVDKVIVHNDQMKSYLLSKGLREMQIVVLEIFDYLHEKDFEVSPKQFSNQVIIAGNLDPSKVGYLQSISDIPGIYFQLFGANYDDNNSAQNSNYNGSFLPEELPKQLKGSFGLVWDGDSAETCSGVYGDYLRFNNPHKTSLYLSTGFPVIIWEKAALADFIKKHQLGLTVNSINEIPQKLDKLSKEDYKVMVNNVAKISNLLREGHFLKNAIEKISGVM